MAGSGWASALVWVGVHGIVCRGGVLFAVA